MLRGIFIFSSFWSSFFHHFGLGLVHHFLGSPGICREFLGIPSKLHKNDEKMKKKRKFLVVFFGQSPRLEFLGILRGIFIFHHFGHHFFIILALVWSIISWEAQRFEVEFLGIPSKIHKHDEEMKKKRRFLVGLFGQSPRLEFLGMLRGIFIFHHFGLGLVHHFLGSSEICREFLGIPSKIKKNDEKMKKKEDFWWCSLARALGWSFWECFEESSFFHYFGHHFFIILAFVWSIISWEAQRFEGNS